MPSTPIQRTYANDLRMQSSLTASDAGEIAPSSSPLWRTAPSPAAFGYKMPGQGADDQGNWRPAETSNEPRPTDLLNAREVAAKLGVSERFIRDHTTRRSPKIRGIKMGKLMRYRPADVEAFLQELDT